MRLPTQCRLRSLLAATAGVAVVFGLGIRSARFGRIGEYHQGQEQFYSVVAYLAKPCGTGDGTADLLTVVEKPGGGLEVRAVSSEAVRLLEERGRRQSDRKRVYEHRRATTCGERDYRRAAALPSAVGPSRAPPPLPE